MKRLIFTVLAIVSASISVQAKYSGGAGTSGNPYKISTAADLLALAANTSDYDANFVLTADINLGGTAATAVIAPDMNSNNLYNYNFDGTPFTGVFDGAGHKIINLNIHAVATENDYLGLFGVSSGEIKKSPYLEVFMR